MPQLRSLIAMAVVLFAVSSCGKTAPDPFGARKENSGRTHLAAVRSHPVFFALIQTPNCESATKSFSTPVFTAAYVLRVPNPFAGERTCDATARILIDARTAHLTIVEECASVGYRSEIVTSDYGVEGEALRLHDYGTIEAVGAGFVLNTPRSVNGRVDLVRDTLSVRSTGAEPSPDYSVFCADSR
jgi:hypothetical protein